MLHQNIAAAIDSLVVCKFVNMAVADEFLARALSAATGVAYSTADLLRAGERIWNLERLYNLREGFTRADDTLPRRLLEEPVKEGPKQGMGIAPAGDARRVLSLPRLGRGWRAGRRQARGARIARPLRSEHLRRRER